jgi:hypothetical protein
MSTIIIVAVIIVLVFLLSRNVNPATKTDEQLIMLYERANKNYMQTLQYSKDFELLGDEMRKRGLLPDTSLLPKNNPLHSSDKAKVEKAIKQAEESGMVAQMQEVLEAEIPQKIFSKTIEIAKVKGITEEEASNYFNELFEKASLKYKNMGLSEIEADKKALFEVLAIEVEEA